jgi:zinc protease
MFQRLRSTAYLWHNYGNSTIGARSDVENVPIERLQAFYRMWYRPDNATLIVAGRIDPAAALSTVQKHFGKLSQPKVALPKQYTIEPTQDGEREVNVRRTGDTHFVALAYHTPGVTHPDSAALAVLINAIGDAPAGRLHKALVETKLAAFTGGGSNALRDGGMVNLILVAPKDTDVAKAEAELLRQAESAVVSTPISADEVAQAKQRIGNAYERDFANVNSVAMSLTESVASGDWRLYFLQRDRIAAVTVEDVNRVARTYLKASNRSLARFIPTEQAERVDIAAAPSAAVALKGYTGRAALATGETFDPTPANIDTRTETFIIGDKLKVSLLPKDTRGDTVAFNATFRFGDIESIKRSPKQAAGFAGSLLMNGSSNMTREQIAQRFEALKTSASVSGGPQSADISLNSRREHLSDALALAADILRNPKFPEAEFEQFRLQTITVLESVRKEPGTIASMAMSEYFDPWPKGHPFAHRSIDQSLADTRAVKREEAIAFHRDFYGTAEGEISIVGDFDPAAVKAQLRTLFGDWRSAAPNVPIRTHYTDVRARAVQLEAPDKANAVVLARSNLSLNDNDADYPALMVASNVLGGGSVSSRLGDRLRQKEGLSYNVGSSIVADSGREGRDDAGQLSIQAIAAPENVTRLDAALREEVARFVRDGITAAELKASVNDLLTQRQQGRASDASIAGLLGRNLRLDRTMAWTADFDAKLKALTVSDVNAAIRKHIKPDALSVFAAGDFAKAKK